MDSIAQAHTLGLCHIRIPRRLPELGKINFDIEIRLGKGCILQIFVHIVAELLCRRTLLELAGAVQDGDLLIGAVMLYGHDLFREFKERAVLTVFPVGMHACDHILDTPLHLEVDQVLAIHDLHAVVGTPVTVEHCREHVPFVFAPIGIQETPIYPAEAAAYSRGAGNGKCRRGVNIRPELKRAVRCRMAFQRSHCRLGTDSRKWGYSDEVLLVLDMPRRDLQETGQRCRDLINAKRLVACPLCWLCEDDPILYDFLCVETIRGIGHLQLIGAVPLFCHETGKTVAQFSDPVGEKRGFRHFIQAWDHSVHHLGVISTDVISPDHEMLFFPGFSSGKSFVLT